jgi:hypothetical protein
MNKIQSSQLDSFQNTDFVLEGADNIWNLPGYAKFVLNVGEFRSALSDVIKYQLMQQLDAHGVVIYSQLARKEMAEKSVKVRSAVQNFASDNNNMLLYQQVRFPEAMLLYGRIQNSIAKAHTIEEKARAIIDDLLPYKLSVEELDEYLASIVSFENARNTVKNLEIQKKNATAQLKVLCPALRNLIEVKLRKGATQFMESAPDFYKNLLESFSLNSYKTHYTEFDIETRDKTTGALLGGVKITATSDKGTMEQYSNPIGAADFKRFQPAFWNITYECPGYEILTMANVKSDLGRKVSLVAELVKTV